MVAELVAANAATQATVSAIAADNASIKEDNASMKALLTQLIQMQVQSATHTAQKTEPKTETETETKTETETDTEMSTELQRMGVLQDSHESITHSHDLPVTAIFTELGNLNVLTYTDHQQHVGCDKRRTVDPFSLYLFYKDNDQSQVIERIEELFKEKQSSTAYKANTSTLIEELKTFSNPTQHTRMMIFLRALIFSRDTTTQTQTANMVKTYMATQNEGLEMLREHVLTHGSPPHVPGIDQLVALAGSLGAMRLDAMDNPKYFEKCLKNMFDMVIECNSRMRRCVYRTSTLKQPANSTRRRSLATVMQKQAQMRSVRGDSCAAYMATQHQKLTLTGLSSCCRWLLPIRDIKRPNERC